MNKTLSTVLFVLRDVNRRDYSVIPCNSLNRWWRWMHSFANSADEVILLEDKTRKIQFTGVATNMSTQNPSVFKVLVKDKEDSAKLFSSYLKAKEYYDELGRAD